MEPTEAEELEQPLLFGTATCEADADGHGAALLLVQRHVDDRADAGARYGDSEAPANAGRSPRGTPRAAP